MHGLPSSLPSPHSELLSQERRARRSRHDVSQQGDGLSLQQAGRSALKVVGIEGAQHQSLQPGSSLAALSGPKGSTAAGSGPAPAQQPSLQLKLTLGVLSRAETSTLAGSQQVDPVQSGGDGLVVEQQPSLHPGAEAGTSFWAGTSSPGAPQQSSAIPA